MMWTIFKKEWRENARWAVLALVGLALAEGFALWQIAYGWRNMHERNDFQSLCSPTFLMATTFGCAAVGLLLGLLQTLPERAMDRWAFLVHRPLSASRLFWGKAAAGLALYLLATIPPFLGAILWAAWPGHLIGPFVPDMAIPGAMDIAAGLSWYFAGFLVGIRQARWWGTRLLPLAAAFYVSFTETHCWALGIAFGYVTWIGVALLLAAWASFRAQGDDGLLGAGGRLSLFVALSMGGCLLVLQLGDVLLAPLIKSKPQSVNRHYEWTHDGQVLIEVTPQGGATYVTDLDGKVLDEFADWRVRDKKFSGHEMLLRGVRLLPSMPETGRQSYRSVEGHLVFNSSVKDAEKAEGAWFYSPMERRFLLYDFDSRRLLARLGPEGQKAAGEPCPAFPEPLVQINDHSFLFLHSAYAFEEKTGKLVRLTPEGGPALYDISGWTRKDSPRGHLHDTYAVTDREGITFLDSTGTVQLRVPHLYDLNDYGDVYAGKPDGPGYFFSYYQHRSPMQYTGYFVRLDDQGNVLTRLPLGELPQKWNPKSWWDDNRQFCRPFLAVAWPKANRIFQARFGGPDREGDRIWLRRTLEKPHDELTYLGKSLLGGLISAILICIWGAWSATPLKRTLWIALGTLLLGPGAMPAFLVICPWIGCERCPACGRLRRRNIDSCSYCKNPVSSPAPIGTEIFELPINHER